MLRSDAIANEQFFTGGSSEVSAAIRLAQGVAKAGRRADVEIGLAARKARRIRAHRLPPHRRLCDLYSRPAGRLPRQPPHCTSDHMVTEYASVHNSATPLPYGRVAMHGCQRLLPELFK